VSHPCLPETVPTSALGVVRAWLTPWLIAKHAGVRIAGGQTVLSTGRVALCGPLRRPPVTADQNAASGSKSIGCASMQIWSTRVRPPGAPRVADADPPHHRGNGKTEASGRCEDRSRVVLRDEARTQPAPADHLVIRVDDIASEVGRPDAVVA
jgi:hypothetical protein